jgi:hypothetical protein
MATLRSAVRRGLREETTTEAALRRHGFSERMIESFLRPWFGGVFLDRSLEASSKALEFTFRMFASGDAVLPAGGMGAIPRQVADGLPAGAVRPGARVEAIDGRTVRLSDGEAIRARAVVVATEAPTAHRLLHRPPPPAGRGVRTLYFDGAEPPVREPILVLNGETEGPVNDLCVVSEVAPSYAPAGRALIGATVLDHVKESDEALLQAVRAQLSEWFGDAVRAWRHLRTYRIAHALPAQGPRTGRRSPREEPGRFVCGDHCEAASLQGAMVSGRRAAEAVLEELAS